MGMHCGKVREAVVEEMDFFSQVMIDWGALSSAWNDTSQQSS
jgi:hypothetical protein